MINKKPQKRMKNPLHSKYFGIVSIIILLVLNSCATDNDLSMEDYSFSGEDLNLRISFEDTIGTENCPELSEEQKKWLVSLPAIIMRKNKSDLETLQVEEINDQSIEKWNTVLIRDWGIHNRDELLNMISRMEYSGHNESFLKVRKIINKYPGVSGEKITGFEPLSVKNQNYYEYVRLNYNLYSELNLMAWDLGRMTSLIRWGYQIGYLKETESWNMLLYFGKKIQRYYSSWEEYGYAYKMGRIFWASGFNQEEKYKNETDPILTELLESGGFWDIQKWKIKLPEPAVNQLDPDELSDLKKQTEEADKLFNVSARKYQSLYVDLGNYYLRTGDLENAESNYQKALRLNANDWDTQLRMAKVEILQGNSNSSFNRLSFIESNCNDVFIQEISGYLLDTISPSVETRVPENYDKTLILHPYENIPDYILSAIKSRINQEFKISVVIGDRKLALNNENQRSKQIMLDRYIENVVKNYYEKDNENYRNILLDLGLDVGIEELTKANKYQFVEYLYNQSEEGRQIWPELINKMVPQYDAEILKQDLVYTYRTEISSPDVVGVLGITVQDIYTQNYNFLFGWNSSEGAVMSIYRFYDRETLMTQFIRRSVNQAFSSAGFILGIPRCTVSSCPRAYPHSLEEHDKKGDELCFECKEALSDLYKQEF